MANLSICLTRTERGTFLAATNESPYLCLEAATEDAVVTLARDALAFCEQHKGTPTPVISRSRP